MTRPLVVVANRLPVSRGPDGWQASAGGLVTALQPVVDEVGGAWVGWDDDADGVPARVPEMNVDLHAVALSRAQVRGYYHGFANRTLWPLFHDLVAQPVVDRRWWRAYQDVNRAVRRGHGGRDRGHRHGRGRPADLGAGLPPAAAARAAAWHQPGVAARVLPAHPVPATRADSPPAVA